MRRAPVLALVLLAACGQASDDDPPIKVTIHDARKHSGTPSPVATLPAPESLVGEYRVAGIDGADFNASFGIALSITSGQVSFEPACAFTWSYAYRDGVLDIERRQEKRQHPPPPTCDEPLVPELQQLATALDAVSRAGRTPANGIELSGNGRSVLLFSQ